MMTNVLISDAKLERYGGPIEEDDVVRLSLGLLNEAFEGIYVDGPAVLKKIGKIIGHSWVSEWNERITTTDGYQWFAQFIFMVVEEGRAVGEIVVLFPSKERAFSLKRSIAIYKQGNVSPVTITILLERIRYGLDLIGYGSATALYQGNSPCSLIKR